MDLKQKLKIAFEKETDYTKEEIDDIVKNASNIKIHKLPCGEKIIGFELPIEEKKYTIKEIEEFIGFAFSVFVEGEDNSWKCKHNYKIIIQSIKDKFYLDKG